LTTKIHIALPVLNEPDYLQACLDAISSQTYRNFELWVCVNQPESWNTDKSKADSIVNNLQSIKLLKSIKTFKIHLIDKSSPGKGWENNKGCVGWARKVIMDAIQAVAGNNDLIVSLDADTVFGKDYFRSLINIFKEKQQAVALSNPYYHLLTADSILNRAILRYEIYMRYYALNMFRIGSPYSYTALGSAIALPNRVYSALGGITPKKSGEDFYFLQKLTKYGRVIKYNTEKVYPAARYSDRVFFGTGPALIKGSTGNWDSYPLYHFSLFDHIKKTIDLYPAMFEKTFETPLTAYLNMHFKEKDIWLPLRKNYKVPEQFVIACHHKIDGLRMLQYLKTMQKNLEMTDESCLKDFFYNFFKAEELAGININFDTFSFAKSTVEELDDIRKFFMQKEQLYQYEEYKNI